MLDFTTDVLQIGTIKRTLTETFDGDIIFKDYKIPKGIKLSKFAYFTHPYKADKYYGTAGNLIKLASNGNYTDSGVTSQVITSIIEITGNNEETFDSLDSQILSLTGYGYELITTSNVQSETIIDDVEDVYFVNWSIFAQSEIDENKIYFSKVRASTNKEGGIYFTESSVLGNLEVILNAENFGNDIVLKATSLDLSTFYVLRINHI